MISTKKKSMLKIIHPDGQEQPLLKSKILLGSAENCDIVIHSPSISHYHALLSINELGDIAILDLGSTNGTYLNGFKVSNSSLEIDDSLTLGTYNLQILSDESEEEFTFQNVNQSTNQNVDQDVEIISNEEIIVPLSDGTIFIDNEYCNITFDESGFIPLQSNPLENNSTALEEYIELETWQPTFDILEPDNANDRADKALRITTLINGNVLETSYIEINEGIYHASGLGGKGDILIDLLRSEDLIPFIEINNSNICLKPLPGFRGISEETLINENNTIALYQNTYQLFIELVDAPLELLHISDFYKEKSFYQETSKRFASIMLPMLLLLLIDFSVPKPEKKLSIIYRKPMQAENNKIASKEPVKSHKNDANKKVHQQNKKVSFSKAGKKQTVKKTNINKISPKIAQTKKSPVRPSNKAKVKVAAYQFKMANMGSIFSQNKKVQIKNSRTPSAITSATNTDFNTKVTGVTKSDLGTMGKDTRGNTQSFGTQGLVSKAGNDTAYMEPKTVILGSMDPELLRKILQEYLPQFRHCYQQELVNNSESIKGVVDLNFEIVASGKVAKIDIRTKDTRFSKRGTNCMAKVLSIIDFPRPKGGGRVAVRQPLNFFSEKERG